jgi:hypothetical protein
MQGARRSSLASPSGMSFVSMLLALVILAALYFGYFHFQSGVVDIKKGETAIDRSRDFACRMNRQTIERELTLWRANHEGETPTLEALAAAKSSLPRCPEGGRYSLEGSHVQCSIHP